MVIAIVAIAPAIGIMLIGRPAVWANFDTIIIREFKIAARAAVKDFGLTWLGLFGIIFM